MPIDPSAAIKTGLALWDQRKWFKELTTGLRRRLAQGKLTIVVFGAGGVGKTTLGTMLSDDFDPTARPLSYQESLDTETYWLKSNPTRSVIVAPGQERRIETYWPDLYRQITNARRIVVVYVGAYGYHALSDVRTVPDGEGAAQDYLAERRAREIELLDELAGFLSRTVPPIKLLTLVTKQDLWWAERDKVTEFYENGDHARLVERIRNAKGGQHFAHEYAYASLCLQNLRTTDGRVIGMTTAGYEDSLRLDGQQRVIELLQGFAK